MSYTIDRAFPGVTLEEIEPRVREALMQNGFGVLTEIDVAATMKKKIDVDMAPYKILGACNPKKAFEGIGLEPKLGAMLPCNVILRGVEGGVEVSAVEPGASFAGIDNAELAKLGAEVRAMLEAALAAI